MLGETQIDRLIALFIMFHVNSPIARAKTFALKGKAFAEAMVPVMRFRYFGSEDSRKGD
jgi:hypothetical protein